MPRKWYEAEVVEIIQIGSQTRQFLLKIDGDDHFQFIPGQFITMDLPLGEKRLDRWRSYSIASSNTRNNTIELCIVKLEGGKASTYLFNEIKVGSKIAFKGPDGQFVLPEDLSNDIVMICTGTGVAPFRSMIQSLIFANKAYKQVHLIFGTRYKKDIIYRKEFEKFSKEYPSFKYSVCLSRESHWEGDKGYVHEVYEREYGESKSDICFYLCGWSQMVDEAKSRLTMLGYSANQIKLELYG